MELRAVYTSSDSLLDDPERIRISKSDTFCCDKCSSNCSAFQTESCIRRTRSVPTGLDEFKSINHRLNVQNNETIQERCYPLHSKQLMKCSKWSNSGTSKELKYSQSQSSTTELNTTEETGSMKSEISCSDYNNNNTNVNLKKLKLREIGRPPHKGKVIVGFFSRININIHWFWKSSKHVDRVSKVHFDSEVIAKAELKGETAGVDRYVPLSHKKRRRRKLDVTSTVDQKYDPHRTKMSDPGLPELDEDYSTCEKFVEKYIINPKCCTREIRKASKEIDEFEGPVSAAYRRESHNFSFDLEVVGEFIEGHLQSTLVTAHDALSFLILDNSVPVVGLLAAQLWLFAFGVHELLQGEKDDLPTEDELSTLLDTFATFGAEVEMVAESCIEYSKQFTEFYETNFRSFNIVSSKASKAADSGWDIKVEIFDEPVLHRGEALALKPNNKQLINDINATKLVVRERMTSKWNNFAALPKNEKLTAIMGLLSQGSEGLAKVKTNLRFLMEDVIAGKCNDDDPDFLDTVADLERRVKYFINSRETTRRHAESVSKAINGFYSDFHLFVTGTVYVFKRVMELRDIIHVDYEYLQHEYKVDITRVVTSSRIFEKPKWWACTCCKPKLKQTYPTYLETDFFRTYIRDLCLVEHVTTNDMEFKLSEIYGETNKSVSAKSSYNRLLSLTGDPMERLLVSVASILDKDKDKDKQSLILEPLQSEEIPCQNMTELTELQVQSEAIKRVTSQGLIQIGSTLTVFKPIINIPPTSMTDTSDPPNAE